MILAFDPGASETGWAIIDPEAAGVACSRAVVAFGFLRPPGDDGLCRWAHEAVGQVLAQASKRVRVVATEVPPEKVRATDFAGNTLRALVVQGRVGAALVTAAVGQAPNVDELALASGVWRPRAKAALQRGGFLYDTRTPLPLERPTVINERPKPMAFEWSCGHRTSFGTEWCTECAPVSDARARWKASACTVASLLLGDRWESFAEPVRKRSRTARRDHQRPGLPDAAEAVLIGLSVAEHLHWSPTP